MNPKATLQTTERSVGCSILVRASAQRVFEVWADVPRWHTWDPDTQWARLDGAFGVGSVGKIKPSQGLAAKMVVTAVQADRAFTVTIRALGTRMDFDHELQPVDGDHVSVRHTVRFSGLLAGLFRKVIGDPLQHGLPITLEGLRRQCETANSDASI